MTLAERLDNYETQRGIAVGNENNPRFTSPQRRRLKHKRLHDVAENLRKIEESFDANE